MRFCGSFAVTGGGSNLTICSVNQSIRGGQSCDFKSGPIFSQPEAAQPTPWRPGSAWTRAPEAHARKRRTPVLS